MLQPLQKVKEFIRQVVQSSRLICFKLYLERINPGYTPLNAEGVTQ